MCEIGHNSPERGSDGRGRRAAEEELTGEARPFPEESDAGGGKLVAYDALFKELLRTVFRQFMERFFPEEAAHRGG
jgi:hypothetical protein